MPVRNMKIRIKRYEIASDKVSEELSGLRIALFSDTHNRYYGPDGESLVSLLEAEKPDLAIFAGDGIRKSSHSRDPAKGCENAAELFAAVAARFPLYYVNGNHERRLQKISRGTDHYRNYVASLKECGVQFLSNESRVLMNGRLRITGLDLPIKYYKTRSPRIGYLSNFIRRGDGDAFELLIAHTPAFFRDYADWGADLVLSGHIHGGIVRLPFIGGLISPHRTLFPRYDYGLYREGDCSMIGSSGAGDHKPRLTFNNPFEIVMITLCRKEQ